MRRTSTRSLAARAAFPLERSPKEFEANEHVIGLLLRGGTETYGLKVQPVDKLAQSVRVRLFEPTRHFDHFLFLLDLTARSVRQNDAACKSIDRSFTFTR